MFAPWKSLRWKIGRILPSSGKSQAQTECVVRVKIRRYHLFISDYYYVFAANRTQSIRYCCRINEFLNLQSRLLLRTEIIHVEPESNAKCGKYESIFFSNFARHRENSRLESAVKYARSRITMHWFQNVGIADGRELKAFFTWNHKPFLVKFEANEDLEETTRICEAFNEPIDSFILPKANVRTNHSGTPELCRSFLFRR